MTEKEIKVIAYYLPQFHPNPVNDKWWGKGFTEWTNVGSAKPLFSDHYQPRVPADLGYYDLRLSEVREAQAKMANGAGIHGFCYWHYWFGNGKQLLERPFKEVLESRKPDFPFCLGWANHSWSNRTWNRNVKWTGDGMIMKQEYLGFKDHSKHFYSILKAFKDDRYIKVEGKPLFVIFRPLDIPEVSKFISLWQKLANDNGLQGIYFVGIINYSSNSELNKLKVSKSNNRLQHINNMLQLGFDGVNTRGLLRAQIKEKGKLTKGLHSYIKKLTGKSFLNVYDYIKIMNSYYVEEDKINNVYPTLLPQYDRSPRSGKNGIIIKNSTPKQFLNSLNRALKLLESKPRENKILFLQSWNEWAEGNYVEPDLKNGHAYLNILKDHLVINNK